MEVENKKQISFDGLVRIRSRVSPEYMNSLSREAYHLFDTPGAGEMVAKIFSGQTKEGEPVFLEDFVMNSKKLFEKYFFTGGSSFEFLPGRIDFELSDQVTLMNKIIGEITIKDGIVVKIEKASFPEPV